MRINCPFCGERDISEFVYLGDATVTRPQPSNPSAYFDYVYVRTNSDGWHTEHWYHSAGCRSWLRVTRNVRSHAISAVEAAPGADAGAAQ